MAVSISFFHFESNKFWAFKQMVEAKKYFSNNDKVSFYKMLGTGGKGGFIYPDLSVYSLLCVWKKSEFLNEFIENSNHAKEIKKKAKKRVDYIMEPIFSNGLWDNINPFKVNENRESKKENKIGVITRGKIKLSKQIDFWLNVSSASDAIKNADGVEFYKGIGELPLLSQATFSVWKNHKSIGDFAYKNRAHSEIIKKTKERKWYSEDLFARFEITEIKTQEF